MASCVRNNSPATKKKTSTAGVAGNIGGDMAHSKHPPGHRNGDFLHPGRKSSAQGGPRGTVSGITAHGDKGGTL